MLLLYVIVLEQDAQYDAAGFTHNSTFSPDKHRTGNNASCSNFVAYRAGAFRVGSVHMFVRLFVCLSECLLPKYVHKTRFSHKLNNLELWSLASCRKCYMGYSINPFLDR